MPCYAIDDQTAITVIHGAVDVVSEGNGPVVAEGDYVDFDAVVVRGDDQTELTATSYVSGQSERLHVLTGTNVIAEAFLCQRAGSRIALTGTVEEIFGQVTGNALKPTDTVAVVFDVVAMFSTSTPSTASPMIAPAVAMR